MSNDKLCVDEFLNKIISNDIIFLTESWTNINSQIGKPNNRCYIILHRQFTHKNDKQSTGGLVIYIKSDINAGIEVVRSHYNSILWLKLEKTFFMISDVYLCGLYLWTDNSPAS